MHRSQSVSVAVSLGAIFENPSIEKLVAFCEAKEQKRDTSSGNAESHISYIQRTIDRFAAEMQAWPTTPRPPMQRLSKEIILLAGASGFLSSLGLRENRQGLRFVKGTRWSRKAVQIPRPACSELRSHTRNWEDQGAGLQHERPTLGLRHRYILQLIQRSDNSDPQRLESRFQPSRRGV